MLEINMFEKPSLVTRIAVGKGIGLVVGIAGYVFLPYFWPDADPFTRWGILLWYATLGAIIGVFGVFTRHPVLNLPMPWWIRAPMLGAWMNFVLTFFAFETMAAVMVAIFGEAGILESPFWFVLEGAIVGFVIGYFATKFGGEGKDVIPESDNTTVTSTGRRPF